LTREFKECLVKDELINEKVFVNIESISFVVIINLNSVGILIIDFKLKWSKRSRPGLNKCNLSDLLTGVKNLLLLIKNVLLVKEIKLSFELKIDKRGKPLKMLLLNLACLNPRDSLNLKNR
jgi:hypothetical protein